MRHIHRYLFPFLIILILTLVYSCANIGMPDGGAYDERPPRMLNSTPELNALNTSVSKIEILFDENVVVEKPMEKVIITPPQQNMPEIRAYGKKVVVTLKDTLKSNTTYTIDFTDAIADNNEKNPLENFSYSFSTGDHLDTLAISGKVLNAADLEPLSGVYVGIHSNLNDTAFTSLPFDKISRTDSRGNFTIRGMAPGEYHVFALADLNRDYKYDNPQEGIAFLDSIIVPSSMPAVRQDTIFKDSITIDTIKQVSYTRFIPDDLLLASFQSSFQRKYFQKNDRTMPYKLDIFFGAPTSLPTFSMLNPVVPEDRGKDWYVTERSADNDSITYWITDSNIYKNDSLLVQLNYLRTDSLNQDFIETDTLSFNYKRPKARQPAKKDKEDKDKEEKPVINFLAVISNVQGTIDVFQNIRLEFEQPVNKIDTAAIQLFHKVDSLLEPIKYTFSSDSLSPRKFTLSHKWKFGDTYHIKIDSAAVSSYYGLHNNKIEQDFTIKKEEEYGNLMFNITGIPAGKTAYVELLDKSDKPFRTLRVNNNEVTFFDLLPGEVYARLFIDDNNDGVWTTGDYMVKRMPERVYYYPRSYEIRAFTDHSEDWDLNAVQVFKQKPLEITKNKPQEKKRRNLNEQREQQNQNKQNPIQGNTNPYLNSGSVGQSPGGRM